MFTLIKLNNFLSNIYNEFNCQERIWIYVCNELVLFNRIDVVANHIIGLQSTEFITAEKVSL
jgi:hypothetical protein